MNEPLVYEELDRYYLERAEWVSGYSEDPSTRVGAILVPHPDCSFEEAPEYLEGWNRFPTALDMTDRKLNNREMKYRYMLHAEECAIVDAWDSGVNPHKSTMYVATTNPDGTHSFGGPPCNHCMLHILEAGVSRLVVFKDDNVPDRWKEDHRISMEMIEESGIEYVEYDR